jgi:hypothetical protein
MSGGIEKRSRVTIIQHMANPSYDREVTDIRAQKGKGLQTRPRIDGPLTAATSRYPCSCAYHLIATGSSGMGH